MNIDELVKSAIKAKENAYAPYSGFKVGAAVLTGSGRVFTGANIENASYGATVCAERAALFKAVCEGEKKIDAIAIASDSKGYIYPCGICRQVISEFAHRGTSIICSKPDESCEVYTIEELLPHAFKKST